MKRLRILMITRGWHFGIELQWKPSRPAQPSLPPRSASEAA